MYDELQRRAQEGRPIRVALIGAGKFGSMFLSQARRVTGLHLVGLADLSRARTVASLERVGWSADQYGAHSASEALKTGATYLTEDAESLIAIPEVEVVIDATGHPASGIRHALLSIAHGHHTIMVNVEADALAGPLLARRAASAGVLFSQAYGDQPALIAELIDWARCSGFDVVCAGKGTKYLPQYHESTPETVWKHYGFTEEQVAAGDFNARMFNSFIDGTKSALEMAAVANASGLAAPEDGLSFPACGADDLPRIMRPRQHGGVLPAKGMVEVVSSLERDGRPVFRDLRWGVYVVFEAPTDYVKKCFAEYGLLTDPSGRYAAMYKPYHLIGLELGISVCNTVLRREATGATRLFQGDAVATAKRSLHAGEKLDGEGGYCVYGKLVPAGRSLALNALPIGLAHDVVLKRPVGIGEIVSWADIQQPQGSQAVDFRLEMERVFRNELAVEAPHQTV
jgi:predicted homoserine dehydrogenase-like protein